MASFNTDEPLSVAGTGGLTFMVVVLVLSVVSVSLVALVVTVAITLPALLGVPDTVQVTA
jgi:hypothetical protein